MFARIKTEFRLENFKITFANHQNFIICKWQRSEQVHILFLLYRLIYFLSVLLIIIYYVSGPCFDAKSLIYLSIWSGFFWLFQVLYGLICVTVGYIDQNYNTTFIRRPMLYGFYWVVYCTYADFCIGVSLFYWCLVQFDGDPHKINFTNISLNLMNSVVQIIDMFIVAIPVRILHVYTTFGHTTVYILVNYLYCKFGGRNLMDKEYIYVALDWRNNFEFAIITVSMCFPILFMIRLINFYVYILRTKLHNILDRRNRVFSDLMIPSTSRSASVTRNRRLNS